MSASLGWLIGAPAAILRKVAGRRGAHTFAGHDDVYPLWVEIPF